MNGYYFGILFTAFTFAVIFIIAVAVLSTFRERAARIGTAVFAIVAALHLLALPVIAVFGFIDGAPR
jgi:hypothetical protein